MPLLLVTPMENNKWWVHNNVELRCYILVDPFPVVNVCDKGDNNNTTNTVSNSINLDNIKKGTDIVSSVVRACDTDVLHQNRTDDLDFAKIPKAFIEINSRRMNYFGKAFVMFCY